ncbi:MAG: GIY-YIG nuclease family protein [Myxococcales bacterium]|nr:GIY-YIG nuclease family protein [Myxococcales bacterium]
MTCKAVDCSSRSAIQGYCSPCFVEAENLKAHGYVDNVNWYLYQIEAPGFVKVGISLDPKARRLALQCGSPLPLTLIRSQFCGDKETAMRRERNIHAVLRRHRAQGGLEWFVACDCVATVLDVMFCRSVHPNMIERGCDCAL